MTLQNIINADLKSAMLSKTQYVVDVLRQLKNALSNVALVSGNITNPVTDDMIRTTIRKMISQRHDSIDAFIKGARYELAAKEREEILVLKKYLPIELTPEELEPLIRQAIIDVAAYNRKDMGKVIKRAAELVQGRTNNKSISTMVTSLLS